jgi:hypothetical protein
LIAASALFKTSHQSLLKSLSTVIYICNRRRKS